MTEDLIAITNIEPGLAPRRQKDLRQRRAVLVASFAIALVAWLFGYFNSGVEILPLVPEVLPGTVRVESESRLFVGYDADGEIVGYAAAAEAAGYAGPIEMLVGIDPAGEIIGVYLVQQRESPGFFRLIDNAGLVDQFTGQQFTADLTIGNGVDAVSGATLSAEGVAGAAREAVRLIARDGLDAPLTPEKKPIKFGWPEISLLGLYTAGYFGHKIRSSQWKKRIRWGTLLTGLVVVGFIYTAPFTISMVISLLSGFWPDWQSNLYWYILIGGILFVTTVDAKNPYCAWFCPFGAFQELLAQLTNARLYKPREYRDLFTWLQRGLAFTAVVLGLALRQPGVAGYEPFATLFDLKGTTIQFIFLILVVLASLVMYRPFCNFLCPLDPVYDVITEVRRWVLEVWKKWRKTPETG
jgi:hypothetical protein